LSHRHGTILTGIIVSTKTRLTSLLEWKKPEIINSLWSQKPVEKSWNDEGYWSMAVFHALQVPSWENPVSTSEQMSVTDNAAGWKQITTTVEHTACFCLSSRVRNLQAVKVKCVDVDQNLVLPGCK
jgi:hypothetical protein